MKKLFVTTAILLVSITMMAQKIEGFVNSQMHEIKPLIEQKGFLNA